jgi:predicted alpha/beta hydrolase family esterase
MNAIILHGRPSTDEYFNLKYPSPSNAHWLPWLQQQLLLNGVHAQTPEILEPYLSKYENWAREIERCGADSETVLVGHSFGGGAILRWISENRDVKAGKIILVAPFLDPHGEVRPAFDFEIDPAAVSRTISGITVFHSDDDKPYIQDSVKLIKEKLKDFKYVEFQGHRHFTLKSMKTHEFPELLKECLN